MTRIDSDEVFKIVTCLEVHPAPSSKRAGHTAPGDCSVSRRSSEFLQVIEMIGGPGRDRTDDLFHAMEARSQLRHRPT
jgi:hypothetical protein